MNIPGIFARSYVDAISVATGPLSAETARTRTRPAASLRRKTAVSPAAKKLEAPREACDARW